MNLPQEITIKIGGVDYKLSKFTLPLYSEFLDWAKSRLPDPFENISDRIKDLPPDLQRYVIDKAGERAAKAKSMTDSEIQSVTASTEGLRKIFALLFRKYQPTLTEDQIFALVEGGVAEHGETFLEQVFPADSRIVPG